MLFRLERRGNLPLDEVERHLQSGVYRVGDDMSPFAGGTFSYDLVERDPSYASEVLRPFVRSMEAVERRPLVLDIGAGRGDASDDMESMGVGKSVRFDISPLALGGREDAVVGAAWDLSNFPDASFNGIHSKDMVTHIHPELRGRFFSEICRVLKPGGLALISSASRDRQNSRQYPTSLSGLEESAFKNGLDVNRRGEWTPTRGVKDWYHFIVPRFVLGLMKRG